MLAGAKALVAEDQPVRAELDERTPVAAPSPRRRTRTLGRVRLPIAGPYRPWATAYRLPDGRVVWCIRLWETDRVVTRCFPNATVREFCRLNRLPSVEAEVVRIGGP